MGGKAIKVAQRVNKERYDSIYERIKPIIEDRFDTVVHRIKSFHNKQDFGDLDLLILSDNIEYDIIERIKEVFNPLEISDNAAKFEGGSRVISFNVEELQVDFIMTPSYNWNTSVIFFEHGDLGNYIGKLINSYGDVKKYRYVLKYGSDGLKCKINYKSKVKTIYITKNMFRVFSFIGLDFNRWKAGFNEREDMFDYVITSKFFHHRCFQWEELNSINRQRNYKRPNYQVFLDYIEEYKDVPFTWDKPPMHYINEIKFEFGVDLYAEMCAFETEVETNKMIKDKINGNHIIKWFPDFPKKSFEEALLGFRTIHSAKYFEEVDDDILETDFRTYISTTFQ